MTTSWTGRLFLDSGLMLYAGPVGPTTPHSHHAFQLVVSHHGELTLRGEDATDEVVTSVAVVPSDVPHTVVAGSVSAMMLYVDPDGLEGRRLRALGLPRGPAAGWRDAAASLRGLEPREPPSDWAAAERWRRTMIEALVGPVVRPVPQHPALLRAIRILPTRLSAPLRFEALASELGISESRLAHLFAEELGLPFRSYVAWLRVRSAGAAVQAGQTLTVAAHAAGFSDAAHFTRTFRRMFGIAPSEIAGAVRWVVGPPPDTT